MKTMRAYLWLLLDGVNWPVPVSQRAWMLTQGKERFSPATHETAPACFQSAAAKDPNYIHSPMFCAIAIPARIPNHPHVSTIAKVKKANPKSTDVTVPVGAINTRSRTFQRPLTETMSPPVIKPPSRPTAQTIPCINVKNIWFIASLL